MTLAAQNQRTFLLVYDSSAIEVDDLGKAWLLTLARRQIEVQKLHFLYFLTKSHQTEPKIVLRC
jgi:hypothetical protein